MRHLQLNIDLNYEIDYIFVLKVKSSCFAVAALPLNQLIYSHYTNRFHNDKCYERAGCMVLRNLYTLHATTFHDINPLCCHDYSRMGVQHNGGFGKYLEVCDGVFFTFGELHPIFSSEFQLTKQTK